MLEPEPVKKLRLRAVAVWLRGTVVATTVVATILIQFSHILTIYTQIERKIGTLEAKLSNLVFKTAFFT